MKLFKTVFLVGLATIALGSAAMGADGANPVPAAAVPATTTAQTTGSDAAAPCISSNDGQTKPVQAGAGGPNTPSGATTAHDAQN